MQHERIAVADFGGQYAHLIAAKVRRLGVRADILDPQDSVSAFGRYKGIILSGSPALSTQGEMADYTREIYALPIPILGLCFGHQEIAKHYGGQVEHTRREYGFARLHIDAKSPLFAGLASEETVWMSHGDSVTVLPSGFVELGHSAHAASEAAPDRGEHRNAAIGNEKLKRYGFQFHPEVDDTEHGDAMLENFAVGICGCERTWTAEHFAEEQRATIRERAAGRCVFLLASGGVDSTVCARLLVEALGPERVHLLHIDNGLMRKDESREVVARFHGWGITDNLHFVDAGDAFLHALKGLADPEQKRVAIGNTFIEVCQAEMRRLNVADALLAQGTIYPDTIETGGTSRAGVIKTHHNRVPLVEEMVRAGKVIEPISELYKVEVRELGAILGLEQHFLERHPFPGPGLGVRLLCSRGPQRMKAGDREAIARISAQAARIAEDHDLGAIALPIRSVGVKADMRAYEWPVFLYGQVPNRNMHVWWETVLEAANRIYRDVDGVNRCVYDLTDGGWRDSAGAAETPPAPPRIELLEAYATRERLDLLREADAQVMQGLADYDLMYEVWQCPTVALPLSLDGRGRELIVARPVLSERAMTASPAELPEDLIVRLRESIQALPGVSGLCIDVTTKPPGTIEWE